MSKEPSETTASVTGPPPSVHGSDATRAPRMSRVRAVVLVLTVTLGMMQNVRRSPIAAPARSWARGFQSASSTAASIALPSIGRALGIEEDQLQWIVFAYSLSSVRLSLCLARTSAH
jgi:hypothetical protein